MSTNIPDRWLKYTSVGKRIENTPFVALKCPLSDIFFSSSLPPESKFGLHEMITQLPQVTLIIDLTNTEKYYSWKVLHNRGIEYEKIKVPGHELPSKSLLKRFFHIVDNFLEENNSEQVKLIGVHCTHGVNRTGFFICSYMISKLGFKYEKAVQEFNAARGHDIERRNYLEKLKKFETNPLQFSFKSGSFLSQRQQEKLRKRDASFEKQESKKIPSLLQLATPLPYQKFWGRRETIEPLMRLPLSRFQTKYRSRHNSFVAPYTSALQPAFTSYIESEQPRYSRFNDRQRDHQTSYNY